MARSRAEGVDSTPTAFYRDSPSLTKDRVVEDQIKTAPTPTGGTADEVYLARVPVSALVSEGSRLYGAGDYNEALRYYESAAGRSEGRQLRVFNGLYLVNAQLWRGDEAERALAKIVALGLATNRLSVKSLFPRSPRGIQGARLLAAISSVDRSCGECVLQSSLRPGAGFEDRFARDDRRPGSRLAAWPKPAGT